MNNEEHDVNKCNKYATTHKADDNKYTQTTANLESSVSNRFYFLHTNQHDFPNLHDSRTSKSKTTSAPKTILELVKNSGLSSMFLFHNYPENKHASK